MRTLVWGILDRLVARLTHRLVQTWARPTQIALQLQYRHLRPPLPSFQDVEFGCYSQNGEDGILLFLFSQIGVTDKRLVELGAGDGIECNGANLIINHGWTGLLIDGDARSLAKGRAFYDQHTTAWQLRRVPPKLVHAWIDRERVNALIAAHSVEGSIDLLSLDLDGVDYWIWDALTVVQPRAVILEYNNRWNATQSVTVPYTRDFVGHGASVDGKGYFGASLAAFVKLGHRKGYRLVGANGPNTNAVFLRRDVGADLFPEVTVESCLSSEYAKHQHETKYPLIAQYPIESV